MRWRRMRVGPFSIEGAKRLNELPEVLGQADLMDPAGFMGGVA